MSKFSFTSVLRSASRFLTATANTIVDRSQAFWAFVTDEARLRRGKRFAYHIAFHVAIVLAAHLIIHFSQTAFDTFKT